MYQIGMKISINGIQRDKLFAFWSISIILLNSNRLSFHNIWLIPIIVILIRKELKYSILYL